MRRDSAGHGSGNGKDRLPIGGFALGVLCIIVACFGCATARQTDYDDIAPSASVSNNVDSVRVVITNDLFEDATFSVLGAAGAKWHVLARVAGKTEELPMLVPRSYLPPDPCIRITAHVVSFPTDWVSDEFCYFPGGTVRIRLAAVFAESSAWGSVR